MDTDSDIQTQTQDTSADDQISAETSAPSDTASKIIQLEQMIGGFMGDLQKLQQQAKEQGQMLKDGFENDAEYSAMLTKAKEIAKEKKRLQDKLSQEPSMQVIATKIKDLKEEIKDAQDALSHYLVQYFETSGRREITGTDGEIHEIVTSVRLVKKKE